MPQTSVEALIREVTKIVVSDEVGRAVIGPLSVREGAEVKHRSLRSLPPPLTKTTVVTDERFSRISSPLKGDCFAGTVALLGKVSDPTKRIGEGRSVFI